MISLVDKTQQVGRLDPLYIQTCLSVEGRLATFPSSSYHRRGAITSRVYPSIDSAGGLVCALATDDDCNEPPSSALSLAHLSQRVHGNERLIVVAKMRHSMTLGK